MINHIDKGSWLCDHLLNQGYVVGSNFGEVYAHREDGQPLSAADEVAVQAIVDDFDPLPFAREEALDLVKEASAKKRLEFVTQAAGKDAEYVFKGLEAAQYVVDGTVGTFMAVRMFETDETATEVATEWNAKAAGWKQIGAYLGALEDLASRDIAAETDWQQCSVIAQEIVARIEAVG
ncbi:MAG: hypothetical protein RPU39_00250 [Candidatus Sedimenticola sp. (ex Thyasira tokunagai)]